MLNKIEKDMMACLKSEIIENIDSNVIRYGDMQEISFSQPSTIRDLILCSHLQDLFIQSNQNCMQNLVKRMTRFFVMEPRDIIVKRIIDYAEREKYSHELNDCRTITISTVDKRNTLLVFKVKILEINDKILVDFRLSKGCGLEFKRRFNKIKSAMEDVILTEFTESWLSQQ